MAVIETIQEILEGIDEAQYGRDMREYIHKGIQKCYEEGSAGETDLTARDDIAALRTNFGDVEETSTASKAYVLGDSLVYENILYKVIAPISQGDTLTEGTNIEQTTVAGNGVVGDIYEMPFGGSTTDTNSKSRLLIIPAIKLMIFNIDYTIPANTTMPKKIAGNLPILRGIVGTYYETMRFPIIVRTTASTPVYSNAFADFQIPNSSSQYDSGSSIYVYSEESASERKAFGTIVAPYRRLNSGYPMSSATLLE